MRQRLIRLPEVMKAWPYSRSAIYLQISKGEFPAPVKIGGRAVAWLADEVDAIVSQRIEASRGGQQRAA